jgi:hypothetical protein
MGVIPQKALLKPIFPKEPSKDMVWSSGARYSSPLNLVKAYICPTAQIDRKMKRQIRCSCSEKKLYIPAPYYK